MKPSAELWRDFHKVKDSAIETIKEQMKNLGVEYLDFTECGNCPIIVEGDCDESTYTLDVLRIENDKLWFYASSCDDSAELGEVNVSLEALVMTIEVIEDEGDFLAEVVKDEDE